MKLKMKFSLPLAASVLIVTGAPLMAQTTGTSHPEEMDDTHQLAPDASESHYVAPSHATPTATVTVTTTAPATPVLIQRNPPVQTASVTTMAAVSDPDGRIVTEVPVGPNELPIGTRLNGTLQQPISTKTTQQGSRFTATLTAEVSRNGVVLLPAGSIVYGRITRIHGGRRISGPSAIRLRPDSVSLPDGTVYPILAEVTDLDHYANSHVNNEGTIVGNSHPGQTAAAIGLTTASAVVVGAVVGGGVGAVVGLGVGAGAATVWWLRHDRQQELPIGTSIVFTLNTPLQLAPTAH
ncbi:hypothetical protein [Granulicella sp. L46]|uniref:hypothetical protein n=1 Tax=Granulicella sp. L46 TaxID=1641865 RepID=UPI00131A7BED|nr:hypothetical protein [Granulicella sp. L46]